MEFASEEIGDGTEKVRDFRTAFHPAFGVGILCGHDFSGRRTASLHGVTDLRIFRVGDFFDAIPRGRAAFEFFPDLQLHVGLTGTEPDFPDQDVFEFDLVFPVGNFDRVIRFPGVHRRKYGFPFPVFIGFRRDRPAAELHFDFGSPVGRTENGDRPLLLKHHVRRKHRIDFKRGVCSRCDEYSGK